jgi:hypothetical protein
MCVVMRRADQDHNGLGARQLHFITIFFKILTRKPIPSIWNILKLERVRDRFGGMALFCKGVRLDVAQAARLHEATVSILLLGILAASSSHSILVC